jgi:hypothetical protein
MGLGGGGREVAASRVQRPDLFPATKKKSKQKQIDVGLKFDFLDVIC